MKVLFLSATPGLYPKNSVGTAYNGGGWIASLQEALTANCDIQLGLAFITHEPSMSRQTFNGTAYYPIYETRMSPWEKLLFYHGGYKRHSCAHIVNELRNAIEHFKPDVIHLFGIENTMACVLETETGIPVTMHLQGMNLPYANTFFPSGINKISFAWPPSIKEWIIGNGYIFAKKYMDVRAKRERLLFGKLRYAMGRTEWDEQLTHLLAPECKYFHIDETLRRAFYENAGTWKLPKDNKFHIVSTISDTVYKGLDLILKTAKELSISKRVDFTWHVIGIAPNAGIIKHYERATGVKAQDVNIVFEGVKNADELVTLLKRANVYVHPSYIDNSPNSLCEAQIIGCPVIGTYVGGIPSLIQHERSGLLVPANAPFMLAAQILSLHETPMKAQSLSAHGTEEAKKRHDRGTICNALSECYKAVIADHKKQMHP